MCVLYFLRKYQYALWQFLGWNQKCQKLPRCATQHTASRCDWAHAASLKSSKPAGSRRTADPPRSPQHLTGPEQTGRCQNYCSKNDKVIRINSMGKEEHTDDCRLDAGGWIWTDVNSCHVLIVFSIRVWMYLAKAFSYWLHAWVRDRDLSRTFPDGKHNSNIAYGMDYYTKATIPLWCQPAPYLTPPTSQSSPNLLSSCDRVRRNGYYYATRYHLKTITMPPLLILVLII